MTSIKFGQQVGLANNICTWNLWIVLVFGVLTAPSARGQCEQAKVTASDAAQQDFFGASVDISGDFMVAGAPNSNIFEGHPGAAYVYRRDGAGWIEEQKLVASNPSLYAGFGWSVSISGDVIAVGASGGEDAGINPGAVYVFRYNGTNWMEEAKLVPADAMDGDLFGRSVAIDGDYIVSGASQHDAAGFNAGAAYVFWHNGTTWVEQDKLIGSEVQAQFGFGSRVALNGDVAVALSGPFTGYVFRRNGMSWVEEAKLSPDEPLVLEDQLRSVSVAGDEIVLGVIRDTPKPVSGTAIETTSGAAYVFRRVDDIWGQVFKLVPSQTSEFAYFGLCVGISDTHIVVGAREDDFIGDDSGSAFVFRRSGSGWNEKAKIVGSDTTPNDRFGGACAIDGAFVTVGAGGDDDACEDPFLCDSGSAYVYWLKSSPACEPIPTLSEWGMLAMALLLLVAGTIVVRRRMRHWSVRPMMFAALAVVFAGSARVEAQLCPRIPLPKVDSLTRPTEPSVLKIKFRDDLKVRAVDGNLTSLTGGDISDALAIQSARALTFERLIQLPQATIDAIEALAARRSGVAQPDLAAMMVVHGADGIIEAAGNALLVLDQIEWAQFTLLDRGDAEGCAFESTGPFCPAVPEAACDACDVAPDTCDFFQERGTSLIKNYHGPDPGINMIYAWDQHNPPVRYRGQGIQIADMELRYNRDHEDLCNIMEPELQDFGAELTEHGTAVLGMLVAADNGYGWTGLVPDATAWFFSVKNFGDDDATTLSFAINQVSPGDIVLLERGAGGPSELDNDIWQLTCCASHADKIVVVAAGNQSVDLDSAAYDEYRSRVCTSCTGWTPVGDSGAMIVSAGSADTSHQWLGAHAYGQRVNLQGWGEDIFTLGPMNDPPFSKVDPPIDQSYRNQFANTSGATPFVAAAAASLQSFVETEFGCRMKPLQMRKLLVDTGVAQGSPVGEHIGPIPDMQATLIAAEALRNLDCNGNTVTDVCDIWTNTSVDCNVNNVPDECEIDKNSPAPGGPFYCNLDCDEDCNDNGVPDTCEGSMDAPLGAPLEPGYHKNRYISFVPSNPGQQTALHLSMVASGKFPSAIGSHWWVGQPVQICENSGQTTPPLGGCGPAPGIPRKWFWAAPLTCTPLYMDWHGQCVASVCSGGLNPGITRSADEDCQDVVHVFDQAIVPNAFYEVRAHELGACSESHSPPLGIGTTKWGDIVTDCLVCPCGPPDGGVDLATDVTSVIDKFSNLPCAVIKARADVEPVTPERKVTINDAVKVLGAYQGATYPFLMAPSCP